MYAKDFPSTHSDRHGSIPRSVGPSYCAQRLLVPQVSEVFARDCSTFWNNNAGGLAMIAQDRDTNGRLRVPLTKRLRSALEKIGATSLGELHGLLNIRLQKLINCSDGTISELVSI